jgi:predicted methyltransferase
VADRLRDANRRPAEVLKFFGIRPGMKVLDLWSGGGYYTEILSYLVGPEGAVVAHNNGTYLDFTRAELATRYGAGRLPNVTRLLAENNELSLPAGEFDAVIMTNVYHDIYFADEKIGWERVDARRLLAEILSALKPGGVLGIVDHAAAPGAGPETGGTLHRIDPERVRQDVLAAGFVLEAESDVLRNPADDRTRVVFDPTIQGRTDQFVFRFRKPH